MENFVFESKNFIITYLGKFTPKELGIYLYDYRVHVKNAVCLDIFFEVDSNSDLMCFYPWEQDSKTFELKELIEITDDIARSIINDVEEIIKFINKHLL